MSVKIILFEDEKVITDDTEIAESFNTYFLNITESLRLSAPKDSLTKDLDTMVTNAVGKYKNHPGIKEIKASLSQTDRFEFSHVYPWDVMEQIETIDPGKSKNGNVPVDILQNSKDILSRT